MTIAEKLTKVAEIKEEIRQVVNAKGVKLDSSAYFADYPDKIRAISGGASDIYSYDEVQIGVWVDGRPLYRQMYLPTVPSFTAGDPAPLLEYDETFGVVNWSVRFNRTDGYSFFDNVLYQNPSWTVQTWKYGHSIMVNGGGTMNSLIVGTTAIVTLEYIKTTDEPLTGTVKSVLIESYTTDDGWEVRKWGNGYVEMRTVITETLGQWLQWGNAGQSVCNLTYAGDSALPIPLAEIYSRNFSLLSSTGEVLFELARTVSGEFRLVFPLPPAGADYTAGHPEISYSIVVTGRWC